MEGNSAARCSEQQKELKKYKSEVELNFPNLGFKANIRWDPIMQRVRSSESPKSTGRR
jgi:hypothetical protein